MRLFCWRCNTCKQANLPLPTIISQDFYLKYCNAVYLYVAYLLKMRIAMENVSWWHVFEIHADNSNERSSGKVTKAALGKYRVYLHGVQHHLLTDHGSNINDKIVSDSCLRLGIWRRCYFTFHSRVDTVQWVNKVGERSICLVNEILWTVLLHKKPLRSKWHSILPV